MAGKRERSRYPGIYRLESGLWQVVFRADSRQRSASFPTLSQARAFQTQTKADLARGTWTDPAGAKVPLDEWVEYWKTQRRVAATTRAKDQSRLDTHILPRFGKTPLGRIEPTSVKAWVRDMEAAGLARGTVEGIYALLAQILAEAVEADLIARSPCRGVKFDPSRSGPRRPRALTTEEASRLLAALSERQRHPHKEGASVLDRSSSGRQPVTGTAYTLVLTTLGCGLRWGEVAGLRRQSIHLLRRPPSLEVTESLHEANSRLWWDRPKTTSSQRRVPLPATVAQALAAQLPANGEPGDVVFPTPQGHPWRRRNWATGRWLPALEAARLQGLRFHDLRHTTASWLADAGIPEVIVAALLGHKVGRTQTAGYIQVVSGFEGRVLEVLNERLGAADVGHEIGG